MTQAMLPVDRARNRMPLVCTVISVAVWVVFVAICFAAWLLKTNDPASDPQGAGSMLVPQSTTSTAKPAKRVASESWSRPGRRF